MTDRVALCISGQMRTYKLCYGSLTEHILEPLDPDIFIHTWERAGTTTKADVEGEGEEKITHDILRKLYDPAEAVIEPFKQEYYRSKNGVTVPEELREESDHWKGSIPMFYKLKECNRLKKKHESEENFTYDVVIKMRPDLIIRDPIPQRIIDNTKVLWHSGSTIDPDYHVSDKFAISSSENMDYYCSVWDHLNDYWENPLGDGDWESIRVGERLMYYHMGRSGIETRTFSASCDILRNRRVLENEQTTEPWRTLKRLFPW